MNLNAAVVESINNRSFNFADNLVDVSLEKIIKTFWLLHLRDELSDNLDVVVIELVWGEDADYFRQPDALITLCSGLLTAQDVQLLILYLLDTIFSFF